MYCKIHSHRCHQQQGYGRKASLWLAAHEVLVQRASAAELTGKHEAEMWLKLHGAARTPRPLLSPGRVLQNWALPGCHIVQVCRYKICERKYFRYLDFDVQRKRNPYLHIDRVSWRRAMSLPNWNFIQIIQLITFLTDFWLLPSMKNCIFQDVSETCHFSELQSKLDKALKKQPSPGWA